MVQVLQHHAAIYMKQSSAPVGGQSHKRPLNRCGALQALMPLMSSCQAVWHCQERLQGLRWMQGSVSLPRW